MKKPFRSVVLFGLFITAACAGTHSPPGSAHGTSVPLNQQVAGGKADDTAKSEAPAASNENSYTIIAGDVLQVTVWKEDGMDRETLVLPDGTINFPLIGSMTAAGKTPSAVQSELKDSLKKFIPDASVTVIVKAALGHTVSVIGQVTKPGEIMMGHRLTVMQALSQAGGLTPYASEGNIIILHHEGDKETSIPFPYDDVIEGKKLDKDIALSPGDVVVVPTAGAL
jgi:polysaccharide biosynthesis/export protein